MKNNPSTVHVTWSFSFTFFFFFFFYLSLLQSHKVHSILLPLLVLLLLLSSLSLKKRIFVSDFGFRFYHMLSFILVSHPLSLSSEFLFSHSTQCSGSFTFFFSSTHTHTHTHKERLELLFFLQTQVNLKDFNNELQTRINWLPFLFPLYFFSEKATLKMRWVVHSMARNSWSKKKNNEFVE